MKQWQQSILSLYQYLNSKHSYDHKLSEKDVSFGGIDLMMQNSFIYLLTQHAQWSQTSKPFLLCLCDKGKGVGVDNYIYWLISDQEQVKLYNKS